MTAGRGFHAVVTAALNEEGNLAQLLDCLARQTIVPSSWVIVDTGSTDGSVELAERAAAEHDWVTSIRLDSDGAARGGPIVRSMRICW